MKLTLAPILPIPKIAKGDDLFSIFVKALNSSRISLQENDIIVLAQKIISKSEGRFVELRSVRPSQFAIRTAGKCAKDPRLVELILSESKSILRIKPGTIIVEHRLGFICANAGIDHSNVSIGNESEETVLLLPEDPSLSAGLLRQKIKNKFGINIAVIIIDSHGRPWRFGIAGISIGFSGIPGLIDMRGKPDMFGGLLKITQIAAVDELASAASLMMGEASEGRPAIHVRGFPYDLREGNFQELIRPKYLDLFR